MNFERDFIDELNDYAAKMRQEYRTIDDVLEQAVEHRVKVRVARKLLSEAEEGRLQFSRALAPFLPERPPVALSEASTAHPNDQYWDPLENEDLPMPSILTERV